MSTRSILPIVVGGSGMYIGALINGLSIIPNIDPVIREKVRGFQQTLSSEDFFNLLRDSDPNFASILHVQDSQRIARAYEVYLQTGKSISFYQKNNSKLLDEFIFEVIVLLPNRSFLYSMCDERLEQMFKNGAIEEVEKVIAKNQNIKTSAMKCLGVQEIISYLKGDISKNEALEKAKTKTRQYAKRQITWFKNQIKEKKVLEFSNHEEYGRILKMVSPPGFEPGTT
jgi:tRNA dimethylallyltransferase